MASPIPDKKSEGADDEAEKEEIFTNSPTEAVAQQPVAQQPVDDAPKGKISTRNSRRCGTSTLKSSRSSSPYQTLNMTSAPQDPSVADTTGCTAPSDPQDPPVADTTGCTAPSDPQPITAPEPTTESVGASNEPTTSISKIGTSDSGVVIDGSDAKSCPLRPGIFWKVGSRIEAKDYLDKAAMKLRPDCGPKVKGRKHMEDWYAARIVDMDYTEQTVRVHFDGWSQRFDQWVEMDSDRLRPLTRHSERKERRKKATLKTEHRVGDNVFAKWTDCRMYPALIIGINENGSYEVLFYDGFKKTVQCINIRGMPSDVQKQYAKAGLLPEPGKKIQQKVKELMDSVQPLPEAKAAMSDSGASSSSGSSRSTRESSRPSKRKLSLTDTAPEAKRVELDVSEEVSPAKADHIPCPIPKDTKTKGRYTKSRKRNSSEVAVQPKETATLLVVGEGHEEESDRSTVTPQTPGVKIKSEKMDTCMDEGQEVEKIEVKQELVEQEGPVDLKEVPTADPEVVPCEMLDMSEQPDSLQLPTDSQPGPSQADPGSEPGNRRKSTDSVSQGPPGARAPKEFTVVDDHNKYKCPFTDCSKGFRKLSLVEYHVKYYHTEDGQKIATPINPPPRKRKKTTSICSTDSEISVGGGLNTSKVVTPSLSAHLPQPSAPQVAPVVTEEEVITDAPSVQDISEVETRTSTTEEYEAETVAVDDDDDRLCTDDVVSCICQINEENGLMIQCDYCLCWQHAVCMDITEETLPKKYVCYVCCNPPGVRESMRYSCDQDWLKQGMMARFDMLLEDPTSERKAQIMQATHQLVADMHNVREVLSSTKHQLHAVKVKNTEEVKLWSRNLPLSVDSQLENNRDEHIDVGHEVIDVGHEETPPPGHEDTSPPGNKDIQATEETPSDRTLFTGDEDSKNDSTSPSSDSQMRLEPGTEAGVKDGDVETSVVMPQTEGEGLVLPDANVDTAAEFDSSGTDTASTMSMMLASEDEDRLADVAGDEGGEDDPFSRCEINLLEHILATQDEADRRFDLIEEQVALLESEDNGNRQGENILRDLPRVKKALHQLLHDLTKVKRMALYR